METVAISTDGEYLAAGSANNKVYLFERGSSTPLWSYTTGNYVMSVAISADGEYTVAGSLDNKIYLFDCNPPTNGNDDDDDYSVAVLILMGLVLFSMATYIGGGRRKVG